MATLEQQRAKFALGKVEGIKGMEPKTRAKYKTQLLKLPARLHTSGLGQTVGFYLAAGGDKPEVVICGWLEEWLRESEVYGVSGPLIHWITGSVPELQNDDDKAESLYRHASADVRALAVWLKRFAEAFIEGKSEDD